MKHRRLFLLLNLVALALVVVFAAPPAFALDVLPSPVTEPPVDVRGTLYRWFLTDALPVILTGLSAVLAFVMTWFGLWLRGKAKDSKLARVGERVWIVAQAVVHHVDAVVKPQIAKAAADGRITAEEARDIKLKAAAALRESLGDAGMAEVRKVLKLDSPGGLEVFLSGVLERALQKKKIDEAPLDVLPIALKPPAPATPPVP